MRRDLGWWYWLFTAACFGAALSIWPTFIYLTMALTVAQTVHVIALTRDVTALPVQVRIAYLVLLLAALWSPLQWLHWVQLAGTTARVAIDYCLLARALSLVPWNRRERLTLALIRRTFFSRQTAMPPCGQVFSRIALEQVRA